MNSPRTGKKTDFFSRLKFMERRGSGFRKIIEDYDFQENTTKDLMPKFLTGNDEFVLTLYNLNYMKDNNVPQDVPQDHINGENKGGDKDRSLEDINEIILKLITKLCRKAIASAMNRGAVNNNPKISRKEIPEKSGGLYRIF